MKPAFGNLKVLLADDSRLMIAMETAALNAIGMTNIDTAKNGEETLSKLESQKYDLVILDWMMPEITGYDVLERIRITDGPNKDTAVIMVTGEASKDKIMALLKLGINGYVVKPFTSEILGLKVKGVLEKVKA